MFSKTIIALATLAIAVTAAPKGGSNKGKVSFTLPNCIKSGNYFLRGELLALHGAGSTGGAQFYVCHITNHDTNKR